jgi:hypothetical protein
MKRLVLASLVLCLGLGLQAQHEVGVSLGTSHLLGDFGGGPGQGTIFLKDLDFQSTAPSLGLFYRYNFAKVLALRAQFIYGGLNSNDLYSANDSRFIRGLGSKSSLMDLSAQFELHFIPLQLCSPTFKVTPYIAGGIGISKVNSTVFSTEFEGIPASELQYIDQSGNGTALNIPMSFGIKMKTKKQVIFALETSYRLSFTDKLDGYVRQQNDQFFFINANVSYVFCKGNGGSKMSREMRCPDY